MITSVDGLRRVRNRWLGAGRDPVLFDRAIRALEVATTNIDVLRALPSPTFSLKAVNGVNAKHSQLWRIYANGEAILDYELYETPTDADVIVMPGPD